MKKDSDNILKTANVNIIIFEQDIKVNLDYHTIDSQQEFIDASDLIIANRINKNLYPFKEKVFTRDIYESD